jgi:hypothetical protein
MNCPHDGAELNADGTCPRKNSHVKTRVGIPCPLCGGATHKREANKVTQDLGCAWRQFTRSTGATGMLPLDATNASDFAVWLHTTPRSFGREPQYIALAASGTPLSEAMAHDAKRYTPQAPTVQAPAPVDPIAQVEAEHTPAQAQETPTVPEPTKAERRAAMREALAK